MSVNKLKRTFVGGCLPLTNVGGTRAFQEARVALLNSQTRPSTLPLNAPVHLFPPFMAHVNDNKTVCR